ncbi:histidine--tRNA ligase [Haemophilus sp. oral taxon 036]|jgi:histidine--tRNA ligase|uniref:histidine--tRNA ligase n=1 Tax=Haemophilus sp. oral taxon 036 TaxID=712310 RepID=UPI000D035B49|nr:histidine--tRNA ligase [Haemophilus sp. oral taxon 036]AVM59885.1 histidine--tRNA ligase [Haemophilus sp. oral taxon 036]MBS6051937.1 histidine--tRNA ligase [Haemophilus haemolyticus]MDU3900441.1 histidine--tRNA ligase [Haemophilus haemolyticus]
MSLKYQSIKGMKDVLPSESPKWIFFEKIIVDWMRKYGYEQIRTPILENTNLFIRSIGEATDIVEKEMYSFVDSLNKDALTLRPEGTVACLRACLENNLLYNSTQRLWYMGPMFRHEKPQKGRYRQFTQVGVEALGLEGPDIDAEMISMTKELWDQFGFKNIELQVNTLGTIVERSNYRSVLIKYLEDNIDVLDEDGRRRLYSNPLRVLDSKNESMQDVCNNAPKLIEFLGKDSLSHYQKWLNILEKLNISYVENTRLVRGLDYYNNSVFEWVSYDSGSPLTFCAGGRYNGLIEELGGEPKPGIGFAMGVERVLDMLDTKIIPKNSDLIYIIHLGEKATECGLLVSQKLRYAGFNVKQDFEHTSIKSQLKRADKQNARFCIIIGENEILLNKVKVKDMHSRNESIIDLDKLVDFLMFYFK